MQRYEKLFNFAPEIEIIFHMKKLAIAVASLLMLFTMSLNAQNERVLLFECFTNASCGPCASQNPALDALIHNNVGHIAAIKYHMSWPVNNDPMYLVNTGDNNARKNVYGISSVPHTVVDGTRYNGMPSGITQNMVNNWLTVESPLEMRLSCVVDAAANTITAFVTGRASVDVEGPLRLYVGVIEHEIHFASAPGNNGERDFYDVMKKLLPSSSGTGLNSLAAGDCFTYSFDWQLANIYDMNQLDVIAWVQNSDTKVVSQACVSSENVVPFLTHDAAVNHITNLKKMICSGVANPKVVLSNYGSETLTSAELEVSVNGTPVSTYSWNGNLAAFESVTVDLGEVAFDVELNNTMQVSVLSVNGTVDQSTANDVTSTTFLGTPNIAGKKLKLTVQTDDNPEETTWKIINLGTGTVVLEGGPYDQANNTYMVTLDIPGDGCYEITFYDAGGNGFTGIGYYSLKAGGTVLFEGSSFGESDSNEFYYEVTADVEEHDNTVGVYPNPTTGIINVMTAGQQKVSVYNMAGQCVFEGLCEDELQLDLKPFGSGVYAIKAGDQVWRAVVR